MSGFIKRTLEKILTPKEGAKSPAPMVPPEIKKNAAPGPDPQAQTVLLAWRSPPKNPRLLIAYRPGTDPENPNNLVSVHVRANHHFTLHMKLSATAVAGQPNVFNLSGPLPRWKGRW